MTAAKKTAKRPVPFAERALGLIEGLTTRVETLETDLAAAREEIAVLKTNPGRQRGLSPSVHNTEYAIKRHGERWGVWTGRGKNLTLVEDFESPAECKAHIAKLAAPASA